MSSDKKASPVAGHAPGNNMHHQVQSQYETRFVPECVRQFSNEPLYILVAYWCLQQQGWVHRGQVAEAFHIQPRRASYLMAYLRNRSIRVTVECREALLANRVYRYEIYVTNVSPPEPRKDSCHTSSSRRTRWRVGNADTSRTNTLWNQISRRRDTIRDANQQDDDDD